MGVYIWTNKLNGKQYVGSSKDLSTRLSDYYMNSYINYQVSHSRGSTISAAILKHGLSNFSLQIIVLGPSHNRESISVDSDFIQLEQYYLNRYILVYNIRRIALGPASTSNANPLKGIKNPQYGKQGSEGAAWKNKHSPEQKALWSLTRSTTIFVYDAFSLTFNCIVYGYERLAHLLGVHVNTATRIAKLRSVYADKFFISLVELTKEDLVTIKGNVKRKTTIKREIHVYNKDKSVLLQTFASVNAFMNFSCTTTKWFCN